MATKKTRKNRKRKPLAPPLSFLDRSIYIIIMVLSFALFLGAILAFLFCVEEKYSTEPSVIAFSFGAGCFGFIPLLLFIGMFLNKNLHKRRKICFLRNTPNIPIGR